MDDGAKKAAGAVGAIGLAVAAFVARGGDDLARVAVRGASVADDAVITGARYGDDLALAGSHSDDLVGAGHYGAGAGTYGDDLAGAGHYGDDLAGAGRYGDDLAGASSDDALTAFGRRRTGASFGGAAFDDEVRLLDPHGAATLTDETPAFSADAYEALADLTIEAASQAVSFAIEDDEGRTIPVLVPSAYGTPLTGAEVIAVSARPVDEADQTVGSLEALDVALARGSPGTVALLVLASAPEDGDPSELRLAGAPEEPSRSVAAVLLRAAQRGRRAVLLACAPTEDAYACLGDAVWIARAAGAQPPDEIAEHLLAVRSQVRLRAAIGFYRLHHAAGDPPGMRLVSSAAP